MCNHQDFAGVGVAVPDSMQAYRVNKMKEMGANSWRTAHNPPTTRLLDETDRQVRDHMWQNKSVMATSQITDPDLVYALSIVTLCMRCTHRDY